MTHSSTGARAAAGEYLVSPDAPKVSFLTFADDAVTCWWAPAAGETTAAWPAIRFTRGSFEVEMLKNGTFKVSAVEVDTQRKGKAVLASYDLLALLQSEGFVLQARDAASLADGANKRARQDMSD